MAPKLCGLHRRRLRLSDRLRTLGRHQDANTEPQLRQPQVGISNCGKHDEGRGLRELLQGLDAQVAHDGPQAGLQFLVGPDADSGFRQGFMSSSRHSTEMRALPGCGP